MSEDNRDAVAEARAILDFLEQTRHATRDVIKRVAFSDVESILRRLADECDGLRAKLGYLADTHISLKQENDTLRATIVGLEREIGLMSTDYPPEGGPQ